LGVYGGPTTGCRSGWRKFLLQRRTCRRRFGRWVLCDDEARGESGWTPLGTLTTLPLLPDDDEEAQRVFEAHRGFRAADAHRGYVMEVDPDLVDEVAAP
jgi:hypothetical protein